jgi:putative ABC transport system permease protein
MRWLSHFIFRIRGLLRRETVIDDIEEEMRSHLDLLTESNIERGMRPEEARFAALRSFGNVGRLRDLALEVKGGGMLEALWQDLRYAVRILIKSPGFNLVAVIALALGIGANTAVFSIVNALLLRPLPFRDPERLVQVWETSAKRGVREMTVSYPNFADWRDQNRVFDQVAAYSDWAFTLTGNGEPERIKGAIVSPSFFPVLGIEPLVGRLLLQEEDYPDKAFSVVMSERSWRRLFNSDPQIVGKGIVLNSKTFVVVGVVPSIPDLPKLADEPELWIPISHSRGFDNRFGHYLKVIARLKAGVTQRQAQSDVDAIAGELSARYPDSNTDRGVSLVPLQEQIVGDYKPALLVLLGAVVFVLLIASANVANMLLARAAARQKEIAVRSALGAGRWRLIRQLLTESLLLALLGGAAGLLLAIWGVRWLIALGPADLPRAGDVVIDGRVLAFTLAVSMLTGIVFGLAPALQVSRRDLNETLKEGSRSAAGSVGHRRTRSLLVVSEIALSVVLLVEAGLLMRSFLRLRAVDPGFNPQDLLSIRLDLEGPNYNRAQPVIAFYDQLLEKIGALPGVRSVATRSHTPLERNADYANLSFAIEGRLPDGSNRPIAYYNAVSPDFFRTMEIPVLKGRSFDGHDARNTRKVMIINETLERRYFSGEDSIGKRMTLNDENPSEEDWATIVGVAGDTKPLVLDGEPAAEMYMPFAQQPQSSMSLMIRATGDPASVVAGVRAAVREIDGTQPVYGIKSFSGIMSEAVEAPRFRTFLLGVLAVLALILAMVGIYGVMSYSVNQRTHEIGIRMALGASAVDVLKLVVGNGMALALAGVGVGLAGGLAVTRVIAQFLFGIKPTDPLTFVLISALLLAVAMLACYIPAAKATRVDPLVALRHE